jgi:hypothetical protein
MILILTGGHCAAHRLDDPSSSDSPPGFGVRFQQKKLKLSIVELFDAEPSCFDKFYYI